MLQSIILLLSLVWFSTIGKSLSTIDTSQAQNLAADYDSPLIVEFIDDFANNYDKYSSYMVAKSMEMPASVLQYFYNIASETDYSFTTDLKTLFPFADFKTFITPFPWYTSLLNEVGATTVYAPSDLTNKKAFDSVSKFVATGEEQITYGSPSSSSVATSDITSSIKALASKINSDEKSSSSISITSSNHLSTSSSAAISSSKTSATSKAGSSSISSSISSSSSSASSSSSSSSSSAQGNEIGFSSILSSMAIFLFLLI